MSRGDLSAFSLFFIFSSGDSSDGTGAEVACPTAAAGGGVGAERTGSRATNQSRGESRQKHTQVMGLFI